MTGLPARWQYALHRRQRWLDEEPCLRLFHDEVAELRCDRFGEVCWGYWYDDRPPPESVRLALSALTQAVDARHWHLHGMSDRGRDPHQRRHWSSPEAPIEWTVTEGGMQFRLCADRGQSPGLFLDQRANRRWVRAHSDGARIANLFSYTGAFGIAAAMGGAREVEQVDVSRSYHDWAQENARLNHVADRIEHAAVDTRLFLRGCAKRGRQFDGIICDPPSFARGRRREAAFRVVDDLADLVQTGLQLLSRDGWLLVTSNHEGWSQEQMAASLQGLGAGVEPMPSPDDDYEPSGGGERLLKGFLLRRRQAG